MPYNQASLCINLVKTLQRMGVRIDTATLDSIADRLQIRIFEYELKVTRTPRQRKLLVP